MTVDGVPCMIVRGGTSKGAYFLRDDLPADEADRDDLLLRLMGTPDSRQIDGIGGAHPLTSKVAVVSPAEDDRADVAYLFLQIGVDEPAVSDHQNCGNLLAGVGPFAVERGLVAAEGHQTAVRILMLNSDTLATASFAVAEGSPVYGGDTSISGVPGTASPVRLDFDDLAGATTGALLPTGNAVDDIAGVTCTLIDYGMPVVVLRATDVGVTGYEDCATLEADAALRAALEDIRLRAGPVMGLGDVSDATVPKLTLVAPPRDGGTLCTRTFIPHRCHAAIGVLGGVSVATAVVVPGTVAASVAEGDAGASVLVEHPTGSFEAAIDVTVGDAGRPEVDRAGIIRTARKLMDGTVFPRGPAR